MAQLRLLLIAILVSVSSASRPGPQADQTPPSWASYTNQGVRAASSADGLSTTSVITLSKELQPQLGASFKQLLVTVQPQTPQRLHVSIAPEGQQRWRVPESIVPRPNAVQGLTASSLLYDVVQQPLKAAGQPFAVTVNRRATGTPVFDTSGHSFLFKDQFIELTTSVPEDTSLYGLGEVTLPQLRLPRDGRIVTLWTRDSAAGEAGINIYGAHPFLLQVHKDGTASGMVFLNSNGMDVLLNKTSVTYRAIGGQVELYIFLGPRPEEVIRQYHAVVGRPMMPPFWALGAHQGKWGYPTIETLEAVVANYSAAGLPLEGLWVDIELLNNRFQVFTYDKERFAPARMRAFVDKLHASGRRWAPIFNPGVATMPGYAAFEEGSAANIWIKDATGAPYLGQVWPGGVHFPSYLVPQTAAWLRRQLARMYDAVPFDGMWLDMTEAANFCTGRVCRLPTADRAAMAALEMPTPSDYNITSVQKLRCTCQLDCTEAPADDRLAYPPYAIHNFGWQAGSSNNDVLVRERDGNFTERLDLKAISVSARHPDGTREYDAHNLYGTAMAQQFSRAFRDVAPAKRGFLLTRSTFAGAGSFTGHWTGDTKVSWDSLREATGSILSANMWGLAMTGADICGYGIEGAALKLSDLQLQELCARWISAGAFYPLSRNHMNFFTPPHEPYRWPATTAAAKKAYGLRYRLLTYLYGSMFLAHRSGGTLARPLLFTDPSDAAARAVTQQWLLGEAVLVSPVTEPAATSVEARFTAGAWYSAWDYSRLDAGEAGRTVTLPAALGDIPVHLRGGVVVPMQTYAPVTRDVRTSPVTLVVTLPAARAPAAPRQGGPLPPYGLEPACAELHRQHEGSGRLVSCGLLYADDDSPDVSDDASTQAWLAAVTEHDGRRGTVTSTIKAAGAALNSTTLHVTELLIAGLPVSKPQQQQSSGSPADQTAGRPSAAAVGAQGLISRSAGASPSTAVTAELDASLGVLRIRGLDLPANEAFTVTWRLS